MQTIKSAEHGNGIVGPGASGILHQLGGSLGLCLYVLPGHSGNDAFHFPGEIRSTYKKLAEPQWNSASHFAVIIFA
jgi:hypothetical protein